VDTDETSPASGGTTEPLGSRGAVAVVTDSTAYLPQRLAEASGVRIVPLQVVIGGLSLAEGVDVGSRDVAEALSAWRPVTTSRPSPQAFADTYRELAAMGATGVVSVHLSGDMSGTVESARLAAREVGEQVPVVVVDSRSLGMGLGFAVLTAADRARSGAPIKEVAAAAARRALSTSTWLYVDTLEYLRRGGRIGAAQALLGSALSVKPLLQLVDGRLEPLDKVRTASRALARLEEVAVHEAHGRLVDIAVHHLAAQERARGVADRLAGRIPDVGELHVLEVGAVVGAHVGPGMVAVVIAPRP
jgi:DegV family protein with EDD domain